MAHAVPEKKHAELGPSKWDTWGNCPGSVPLSAGIEHSSSRYAREGTAAHQLLQDCLEGGLDAEDLIGREYEVEDEVFIVDQDMADAVDAAINYVRDTINPERGDILLVEQAVPLQQLTGEVDAEGTSDVVGIVDGGKTLVVADYKHGQGVKVYSSDYISEEELAAGHAPRPNGQLAMYGLGTLHKLGMIYDEIETVKLVVMQPRLEHIDEHEITIAALLEFGDVVAEAAAKVELNRQVYEEGNALDLHPTEKGCKFCKAKAFCPALKNLTSTSLAVASEATDFDDLTLPKKASSATHIGEHITPEQLAEVMRAAPLVEDYIKAIRAEVERRLLAGQPVPGYYLGIGRAGNRAWEDPDVALKELTKSGRLKVADATTAKVISPTQAEKLLKDRPKIWSQIAPLITTPAGGPSVCKDGDKNLPYKLIQSEASDFNNLDDTPVSDVGEPLYEKMQRIANGTATPSAADLMAD